MLEKAFFERVAGDLWKKKVAHKILEALKFCLMKKFFSSGQFWAPYEDGNQKEPFPKKCWKWCLFMLQKYHGLFEKKTFFYIDEQSKTFFLCFLFFFAELLHITFFCFKEISVITTDKKVVFWKLLQKSAVKKSDKNGFAVWAQNDFGDGLLCNFNSKTKLQKNYFVWGQRLFFFQKPWKLKKFEWRESELFCSFLL